MFRAQSDARGRQTALIEEMIGNQKVVQAFGYENRSSERFAAINEELRDASQNAVFYSSLTNPVHTMCQQHHLRRCSSFAGAFLIPAVILTVGGLSVLLALCKPVYEALQRYQLRDHRASERSGLRYQDL